MTTSEPDAKHDHWLEQLTGRSKHLPADQDERLAAALHSVLKEKYHHEMAAEPEPENAGLNRLLQRCRNEGLLDRPQPARWRLWIPSLATVAVTLTLVVVTQQFNAQIEGGPVYRGHLADGKQVRVVAEPMQQAEALQAALQSAAIEARIYQTDERWSLTATLPDHLTEQQINILKENNLPTQAGSKLQVQFSATAQ